MTARGRAWWFVRLALGGLIVVSLALPVIDVLDFPDRLAVLPNLQIDAETYHAIAARFAETWSLDALVTLHPPGFVALLGVLYGLTGPSYVAAKLLLWGALLVVVGLSAWIAYRVYGPGAAWVAALLTASSPALRAYVGTIQYEVVTAALLLLLVAIALHASGAVSRRRAVAGAALLGVVGGALILTREPFAAVVPLVALWFVLRTRPRLGARFAAAAGVLSLALALIPAAGWSWVQHARSGEVLLFAGKTAINLGIGNNPLANGTYNAALTGVGQPAGLAYVAEAPGHALLLAGRKVLYFWGVLRDGWNAPRPAAVWLWRATAGLVPFEALAALARGGWLLVLFVLSICLLGRDGLAHWWILPAIVILILGVHVVTLSSHRFAVPVLPLVFVLGSGPLASGAAALASRLGPRLVAAAAALGVVTVAMQAAAWPLTLDYAAASLDGRLAANARDSVAGAEVRFADAARGERPVILLSDEYLPRGDVRLEVGLRRASDAPAPGTPVARLMLVHLDGTPACLEDVAAHQAPTDRFATIRIPCRLERDGPSTLLVYSLGAADLAFDRVRLAWSPAR